MTTGIISFALNVSMLAVAASLILCTWRLARGPDVVDRLLTLDTLYLNVIALVVLLGIRLQTTLLFEAALVVAMLGFVSTVALARYLTRGDAIE